MRNNFLMVGRLHEATIQLYATHAKTRMTIDTGNKIVQIQQTISHKWDKQQYDGLCAMIPYLHPRIDGSVLKNGKEQIYTMTATDSPTELLISGNISEWKGNIYFNACYMQLVQKAVYGLKISLDGQWAAKDRFINVCGDWPREFAIQAPDGYEQRIYRLDLIYSAGYSVQDGVVNISRYGLKMANCQPMDEYISNEQMQKILLELEIIS